MEKHFLKNLKTNQFNHLKNPKRKQGQTMYADVVSIYLFYNVSFKRGIHKIEKRTKALNQQDETIIKLNEKGENLANCP